MKNNKEYLSIINDVIENGKYKDDWKSLFGREMPRWMQDGKFGIFIHWGVYSVPAFSNEWYSRNMYIKDSTEYKHHIETFGPHDVFGYKDFVPLFTAPLFDAEDWAELIRKSGDRYCVPVAEHHDGFQMYKSEISHWNAAEMGPKRDVLKELYEAFEKKGVVCGASSHRVEHWFFMGQGKEFESDVKEPMERGDFYWPANPMSNNELHNLYSEPYPSDEFMEDWLLRCCELIDNYHPKLLFFDWWIQHSAVKPYLRKFAAYYYNRALEWGEDVAICYKHDAFPLGTAVVDIERGKFSEVQAFHWQTDTAIARNSWGWTEDNQFKPAYSIVQDLMDIISKNGVLLLNVGPKPDGSISSQDKAVLLSIGEWLAINGEAVYGTRIWRKAAEGPTKTQDGQFTDGSDTVYTHQDIRFTTSGDCLYATVLKWPEDGYILVKSLAKQDASHLPVFNGIINDVSILGQKTPIWKRDEAGLHVRGEALRTDMPVVIKVKID